MVISNVLQLMDRQLFMLRLIICHVMIMHFVQKIWEALICTYGFAQYHMIGVTVHLYDFAVIMYFIVYIRKLLHKNCLYAGSL